MIKKSFTLTEFAVVMVVLGFIASSIVASQKNNIQDQALKKAGVNSLIQITLATKQILAKNSPNYYKMTNLYPVGSNTMFSINDSGADAKLIALYKKNLIAKKVQTVSSGYTSSKIVTETGSNPSSIKVSSFTQGFITRNGTYMALKLNNNCTTNETYIYDPSNIEKRTVSKSCGLIFFDVNADDGPNILAIDQYIVSIGKLGIK